MKITIKMPDDCHVHLRRGGLLRYVIPYSERQFSRVVVMPNTFVPITTREQIEEYYNEIILTGTKLFPKMTLYLTDNTKIEDVEYMKYGHCVGCKLYPIGTTVNSYMGVSNIENIVHVLKYMEEKDIPLLIHGEDINHPVFYREKEFIPTLEQLSNKFSKLRMVVEHISSCDMIKTVLLLKNVWATITPHHLTTTINQLFKDNRFNTHMFCMPIVKFDLDRQELLKAATSGNSKFFAGTDSAPHWIEKKETDNIPGCFTAPSAIEHYATAFDEIGKIDRLEDFTSKFGAEFYGWSLNKETLVLEKTEGKEPLTPYYMNLLEHRNCVRVYPFHCGKYINWSVFRGD